MRERPEAVGVAAVLVGLLAFANWQAPNGIPTGVYGASIVSGAMLAMHALGLVLVYRSSRVINFAQVQMASVAAFLFANLVERRTLIAGLNKLCPPCAPAPDTVGEVLPHLDARGAAFFSGIDPSTALDDVMADLPRGITEGSLAALVAPEWMVQVNFWLSLVIAVLLTVVLVGLVYVILIKRFAEAPRLLLTVVTLAAGSFAQRLGSELYGWMFPPVEAGTFLSPMPNPLGVSISLPPSRFGGAHVLMVVAAAVAAVALIVYLRVTRAGVAMRAAAENPSRAEALGVNVTAISARAWLIAGALGGTASALAVAAGGVGAVGGAEQLVRAVAAAVAGAMMSLPLAIAGAMSFALMDHAGYWATTSETAVTALLVVLVTVMLLVQRSRASRAELEAQADWDAGNEARPIPPELVNVPVVRRGVRLAAGAFAVVTLAWPWINSEAQTNLGTHTLVFIIVTLSLLVLTGWAGQVSIGQMAFAGIGAWVTGMAGLPFLLAVPVSALAAAAAAAITGVPALRLRGQNLAVVTLTLSLAVSVILLNPDGLGRGLPEELARPVLLGIDFRDERAFYYLTLATTALVVIGVIGIRRSRSARALIASKDNELAAQAFGINLVRARVSAFAASGFLAGLAGALLVFAQKGVQPATFTPKASIDVFLVSVLGGVGSIIGVVTGAFWLGGLRYLGTTGFSQIANILMDPGLGVVLILVVMPGGLGQTLIAMRDGWLRRIATRHRIDVPSLLADRDAAASDRVPLEPIPQVEGVRSIVPVQYRLEGQWCVDAHLDEKKHKETAR